jgi:membrane protein DedA with SNARE-associated domain
MHQLQAWSQGTLLAFAASVQTLVPSSVLAPLSIILGTFVLEDAATVLAAMQAADGRISVPVALGSLYVGVILGDLGLFALGMLARRLPFAARLVPDAARRGGQEWLRTRLIATVFISRFLPGARLPTYTACGFLGAGFGRFALAVVGATLIWTALLFGVSMRVGALMITYLGAWRWAGAIGFALTLILIGRAVARTQTWRP